MDTLDYLVAGGRIGRVTGAVGSVLKLKPIISCNEEGVYYTVSILRNKAKGLQKLVEHIVRFTDGRDCHLALMHGDAQAELPKVEELVRAALPNGDIFMREQIAASLAVHTGPGLVGILSFCPQEI
jgi:DegV family protein with EDD domain